MKYLARRLLRFTRISVHSYLVASIAALTVLPSMVHAATATLSGNWSDSATWGGSPPSGTEEDVTIPSGYTVALDMSDEVGEIKVMGKLTVATGTYELIADSVIVMGTNAELEVGTTGSRYTGDFTLTLKGEQAENFVHGAHDMGWRALLALNGGTLNLHGEDRVEWTHLDADVNVGSGSITVADAVNWEAGDEIIIVSSTNDWNEVEKRTVSSVTGGGTVVNLTSNLSYWHNGTAQQYTRPSDNKTWTADMRAEVGLLTRNITIQGASDSVSTGFGAHVMIHGSDNGAMNPGYGYVEGVEIYRGGQESQLARYPFHWHLLGGDATGQYFRDNAVHDSFNRGITIHGTDNVTIDNNFFYNTIGHTVFLEDGVEENNTITNNVVALSVRPARGTEVTPSDNELNQAQNRTPSSYWITHPNNTVENNVAAGGEGTGFWYIFPSTRIGLSADLTYYDSATIAYYSPMGSFDGNVAHSYMNGWDIFDRLSASHGIQKNTGWAEASDHVFENSLWYANETALYTGIGQPDIIPTRNVITRNNVVIANQNATMLAGPITTEETLFVARSGLGLNSSVARYGHKLYDGAGDFRDNYYVGYDGPPQYTSYLRQQGGATRRVNWGHAGVETDHPGTNMAMALPDFDFGDPWYTEIRGQHPRDWINILNDEDGTLTGTAGHSLISNHKFVRVGDETPYANANNILHSPHKFARIQRTGKQAPHIWVTREKSGTQSEMFYYVNGYSVDSIYFPAIVNEDFEYNVTFDGTQSYTDWMMVDAEPGDVAIVKFNHMDNLSGLNPTGTSYSSVAQILSPSSSTTGHYLDGNGTLWFRVIAALDHNGEGREDFGFTWSSGSAAYVYSGTDDTDKDGRTNATEGGPGLDTDGDGLPDYMDPNNDGDAMKDRLELFYGLDPESPADLRYEFGDHGGDGFRNAGSTVGFDNVNGAYEITSTTATQYIQHNIDELVHFPGNDISTITIRFKSTESGNISFGWWTATGGPFTITGPAYTGGSGYVEHEFDVSADGNWAGNTIDRLRITGIAVADAVTSIDWLRANGQGDLPGGGPTDVVYVDFGYTGTENGTENTPWNTLLEALSVVDVDGTINIVKDSGDNDTSETFSGGGIIDQKVTIDAVDGLVRIGTP
ncbi:MAG TPA: hypothetical protein EYM88_03545 [Gammaproteobacteria bacterium]|nr:hypothetical protein [Planctomycetaceae bacterium]HIN59165.1 hypothetical protein [Gammaproteobacteria bacterium]